MLQAQAGPNPGAEHAAMPLNELTPHLEPSCNHQKPAGGKAPQPHSIMDATLHVPVDPTGPVWSQEHFHASSRVKG